MYIKWKAMSKRLKKIALMGLFNLEINLIIMLLIVLVALCMSFIIL